MNDLQLQQAAAFLEQKFGSDWQTLVQSLGTENLRRRVGKELTSFMAFPDRGQGGSNHWRGNCSPEVVSAVLKYVLDTKKYYGKDLSTFTLLDPMSGSGTSHAAAKRYQIRSLLYDLNPTPPYGHGNWNALKNEVDDSADLIFFHPPYHSIIQYSGNMWGKPHPDDLSRCENYADFLEKLNYCIRKLFFALRKDGRLAILVGDIRYRGEFHSIQHDMMRMGNFESFIVKGQFNCVSDTRTYKKPFIPIVTEYLLVYHKQDSLIIPFSWKQENDLLVTQTDIESLTWHHLIRMTMESIGGTTTLADLYQTLQSHPKARKNPHYRERIRATLYEHPDDYKSVSRGCFQLRYVVA
ncbi:MAG: SAM-dependent methyltransferase [Hespellia sp.]|nr:SAM-dependent methyltransferase [Hespellia sp.]